MKCAQHADVDATGYCRQCGKPLCPACTRDVQGALYCESCLANIVAAPHLPGAGIPAAQGAPNPNVALALGFIPGLGAVYNGEYVKALIHVLAFGGLIGMQTTDIPVALHVILAISLGCFYFYMPIEAYRTAKAHRGEDVQALPGGLAERDRPVGAVILIALGVLFLLANFHVLDRDWFSKAWPAGLILLGIWIMVDRMRRTS
jgi:hypothetical protein